MKNDSQETKMLLQGLFVWCVAGLLVFAAWFICALLIYLGLFYFTDLSIISRLFAATASSAIITGTIIYRYFKLS